MKNLLSDKNTQTQYVYELLLLLGYAILGLFVGNFLAYGMGLVFCQGDTATVKMLLQSPEALPEYRLVLLLMQGVNSFSLFIITSLLYVRFCLEKPWGYIWQAQNAQNGLLILVIFLMVWSYFPLSGFLVQWNESWQLPDFLQSFEAKAKASEERIKRLTEYLIDFQTNVEFIVGFLVIAVLPGIGEELFFRGLLQTSVQKLTRNPHIAIWLTGFLFSAFHLQLYGLVPRFLLGVLFGYIFYWSGSLWLSVWAHFLNNGITLLLMTVVKDNFSDTILSQEKPTISLSVAGLSSVFFVFILSLFYNLCRKRTITF